MNARNSRQNSAEPSTSSAKKVGGLPSSDNRMCSKTRALITKRSSVPARSDRLQRRARVPTLTSDCVVLGKGHPETQSPPQETSLLCASQQMPCCPEAGPEDTAAHKTHPRSPLVPRSPLRCQRIHLPEASRPGSNDEDGCHTPGTFQKPHPSPKDSAGQGLQAPSPDPVLRLREQLGALRLDCLACRWQAERTPRPLRTCRADA